MHQLIDCLVGRLYDINKPFMRLDHKVFTAVSIDKGTSRHVKMLLVRRKRHRPYDPSARPHGGIKNLLTAIVYNPAVVCF